MNERRIAELLAGMPDWAFYLLCLAVIVVLIGGLILGRLAGPSSRKAKRKAAYVSQHPWFVKEIVVTDTIIGVYLRSGLDRTVTLGFSVNHPDVEAIRLLEVLNWVRFRYQSKPIQSYNPSHTCAYLRLEGSSRLR